jgi:uncharacterized protein
MTSSDLQLAVVTGASSGIGLGLTREFATNGFSVLMCADGDDVHAVAAQLTAEGLPVTAVQADLATAAGVNALVQAVRQTGRPLDAIALNAGVGNAGAFIKSSLEDDIRLIELNVVAPVRLTKAVLPEMVARGSGKVLITSSIASTMPGPYYATYAASKAFIQSFAEAVRYEVKDSGVTITALLPGPTDTDFFDRAGMQDTPVDDGPKDDPAEVARDGFKALMAGDDKVVAGSFKNKLQAAGARLLPDTAKAAMHAAQTKPKE